MRRAFFVAGAALAFGAAPLGAQQHEHDHPAGAPRTHSHRGPGPHFLDAFWVENAYLERKVRPDLAAALGDQVDRYTATLEIEWAVLPRVSLITHVPGHHLVPATGVTSTGLGDVAIGPKLALVNDRRRLIVAVGGDFHLPTGDEERGLGEGHGAFAPFGLVWLPFGRRRQFLVQGAAHADIPFSTAAETRLELGTALSATFPLGVSPLLELIAEVPLEGDESASWAMAPGLRWELSGDWEVGASARVALAGPREADLTLVLGLIRHFPLPGGGG